MSATSRTAPPSATSRKGATEQTKNPLDIAIDGSGFLVVQTPAGERYTRDGGLQLNNNGQLVTAAGNPVLGSTRPDRVSADRPRHQRVARRHRHRAGRHRPDRCDPRQTAAGQFSPTRRRLLKEGLNLYAAGEGGAPQPDIKSQLRQGFIEKSNVNAVAEMSRMIEVTRAYTQISTLLQQQSDLHKTAIQALADVPA